MLLAVGIYAAYGHRQMRAYNDQKLAVVRGYVGQAVTITMPSGLKGELTMERRGLVESVDEHGVVLVDDQGRRGVVALQGILSLEDDQGRTIADGW